MQFSKGMIQGEIEAAAAALGFSRRVSFARLERELARYCPRRGEPELDYAAEPARFRMVAELVLLTLAVHNLDAEIAKLRKDVSARAVRVRKLVDVATGAAA
jgi:hypothetical protein